MSSILDITRDCREYWRQSKNASSATDQIHYIFALIPNIQKEKPMILEVAPLDVIKGKEHEFEASFNKAQEIICTMPGYVSHQLQKCIEKENRYILLVNWETLEHHTIGFRESPKYIEWKALLHHYYNPFPIVEHYQTVYENIA